MFLSLCSMCVCLSERTVCLRVVFVLRRHPACCDCQGELALADRMGANLLVRLCVCVCVCISVHAFSVCVHMCTSTSRFTAEGERVRQADRQWGEDHRARGEIILSQKFPASNTHLFNNWKIIKSVYLFV